VNLLEHEVFVAGLLGHDRIPVDRLRLAGDFSAVKGSELRAGPGDDDHLAIIKKHHAPCVRKNRWHVGGDEVFTLAEANNHRGPVPHRDDGVGIVSRDEHQRKEAANLRE